MTATATSSFPETRTADRLRELAKRRFQSSIDVSTAYFESQADSVARACLAMARCFRRDGRLLVFGAGADATDAQHVSVEFAHPVLMGKRALPAIALTSDASTLTGARIHSPNDAFGAILAVLGRPQDIALAIAASEVDPAVAAGLSRASALGMLTIALTTAPSRGGAAASGADFVFAVPTDDPCVAQEVHETLYHILWELVHVFLDHPASSDAAEVPRHA